MYLLLRIKKIKTKTKKLLPGIEVSSLQAYGGCENCQEAKHGGLRQSKHLASLKLDDSKFEANLVCTVSSGLACLQYYTLSQAKQKHSSNTHTQISEYSLWL